MLRGMWDPLEPGLELVTSALLGGLSNTEPPEKAMWSVPVTITEELLYAHSIMVILKLQNILAL